MEQQEVKRVSHSYRDAGMGIRHGRALGPRGNAPSSLNGKFSAWQDRAWPRWLAPVTAAVEGMKIVVASRWKPIDMESLGETRHPDRAAEAARDETGYR